jgi:hypothetical protein
MVSETHQAGAAHGTAAEAAEFDAESQKGWQFFTKFLLGNVVMAAAALVFVALLTVWS